jgi:tetratricopeptide (TPR) repeat protein/DNA-binding CsgD family transcriptional regulator
MRLLDRILARPRPPRSLRVKNVDAFTACSDKHGITAREGEIIRLLIEGKGNKEITEALFISDHTVKNHIHHIYRKLEIRNRVQLVQCYRAALEEAERGKAETRNAEVLGARWPILLISLLLIGLIGLASAVTIWRPWTRKAQVPPVKPVLAVLDFENLSGEPDLDKWVVGLPLLLTTDLIQSKSLRTLSSDIVFGALQKNGLAGRARFSREELRRLAREMKADYLLTGSMMEVGGMIVVTAFLQDARTGASIRTERIESPDEYGLMRNVDELAQLIKSSLGQRTDPLGNEIDHDVEILTTSSVLAFKYYSEGVRYHQTGDYEQSLLMLRKAVELDPGFAMAYRLMSMGARNLGYFTQEVDFLRTAFELSARLPEDSRERHLIRGDFYSLSESTLELAVEAFKTVLRDRPLDVVVNNNLGMLYYDLEDYESAVQWASVPIRQGTDNPFPYHTKAAALKAMGRSTEAVSLLESYLRQHPANRLIFETLVGVLVDNRDFDGARSVLDRAQAVFPDPSWAEQRGIVLFHTESAAAANEEFRKLFFLDEPPYWLSARERLGRVALAEGRFREAAEEFGHGVTLAETTSQKYWEAMLRRLRGRALLESGDTAAALADALKAIEAAQSAGGGYTLNAALHFLAEVHVANGDTASVAGLVEQSKALTTPGQTPRTLRAHDFMRGYLDLVEGRPAEAARLIGKAVSQIKRRDGADYVTKPYGYYLGMARERAGDLPGATEALAKLVDGPGDRLFFDGYFAKAVLDLARLEDRLGRRVQARDHYRRFLELWRDADSGRPEIAEARTRLQALSAHPSSAR